MKHRIKTIHGISPNHIQQDINEMWSGFVQGNEAAGPTWLSVEAFMLQYYTSKIKGASFSCPEDKLTTTIHTIGYVDDNNLLINTSDETELEKESNNAIQTWNDALEISGGSLSLEKCQYIAMTWQSSSSDQKPKDGIFSIKTKNIKNETHVIENSPLKSVKKYLGITSTPTGDCTEQYKIILHAAKDFSQKNEQSTLRSYEVYISHQSIWREK